jgi:hypothetical protein
MISNMINTILDKGPDPDMLLKAFKKRNVEYSQVLKRLDDALQEQWPYDDSAQLQEINLPANLQIGALSGSKRSRSMYFASHNSQPVHSEPGQDLSLNLKRQKY